MLVLVKHLKNIGYPKKEYFIDLVDLEWCLRALSKDYHVEMVENIQVQHAIGEIKIKKINLSIIKIHFGIIILYEIVFCFLEKNNIHLIFVFLY